MHQKSEPVLTDKGRLLFGAGFVFGVLFALVMLAVVTVTVTAGVGLLSEPLVTIAGASLFAVVVGVTLYLLAFPENRIAVPVEALFESNSGRDERAMERL